MTAVSRVWNLTSTCSFEGALLRSIEMLCTILKVTYFFNYQYTKSWLHHSSFSFNGENTNIWRANLLLNLREHKLIRNYQIWIQKVISWKHISNTTKYSAKTNTIGFQIFVSIYFLDVCEPVVNNFFNIKYAWDNIYSSIEEL